MKTKNFIVLLILSLTMIGFMGCDNNGGGGGVSQMTLSDAIAAAYADGLEGPAGVNFENLERGLRFFADGTFDVWATGLGSAGQLLLSGRWVERTEAGVNIIDVYAIRDSTVTIGGVAHSITTGDRTYSFSYIIDNPERMRTTEIFPGTITPNNNRGYGMPSQPGPDGLTFVLSPFSRFALPYFRPVNWNSASDL